MNDSEFPHFLVEMQAEAKREHLRRWKEWLSDAPKNISEAMGRLMGLSAEMSRAMFRQEPATEILTLEPQMTELLHDCYQLLGEIQGNLCMAEMLLDDAQSTSISPT